MKPLSRSPLQYIVSVTGVVCLILLSSHLNFFENQQTLPAEDGAQNAQIFPLKKVNTESARTEVVDLICILCSSTKNAELNEDERQFRQAVVMLKSAVLYTQRQLHFHFIGDNNETFNRLVQTTSSWPETYSIKLKFSLTKVWYPEGSEDLRVRGTDCATELMFVPDILLNLKKGIFIDTDTIFMRPVEQLWDEFNNFHQHEIAGITICRPIYFFVNVPSYGVKGLNSGVVLLDLDRIRKTEKSWTNTILAIYNKYKKKMRLGDQDLWNIYFNKNPEKLYDLNCTWNYREAFCNEGINTCSSAGESGVSILHGNAQQFVKGAEMKLQSIFETFEIFELNSWTPEQLVQQVEQALAKVDENNEASKCKDVPGIDDVLLKQFKKSILELEAL
ncbi:glucoside xylosyltransferase 2 [Eurytemora carolleeae]|uniref:glucoside xylosyltransferase 2 n=1 Tax=Eurytemora carolleeae TaxID=1294199 RepID=UPI000C761CFC|nr:glucoside xylosyltransferase 2 [Eurytemora carolleeae]|eukprot:XP_023347736.1 glucoside xylosyltransferase 2-like [Eurytemora affinis]